ncbi:MAG: hypothetical protein HY059_06350 [Proteobacteria bacterium]|nr:hypothetical protein [Pseudomonadota bacterium]
MRRICSPRFLRAALWAAVASSAAAGSLGAQGFRARVGLLGFDGPVVLDTLAIEYAVNASPRTVLRALDDAFRAFDIDVTVRDSLNGVIGNVAYRRRRTFAKAPASQYLNCGAGMTGWNADEMRLTIAILALVDPGPNGGTKLRIGMAATAEDIIGQSRPPIGCATFGRLEAAMAEFVKKKSGR